MAENGYKHLTEPLASPEVCWESWELLLARDVIKNALRAYPNKF